MIFEGALTAAGVYIVALKSGQMDRVMAYEIPADIAVSAGLAALFAGTYSGLMAALVGGILFSILLMVTRLFVTPRPFTRSDWDMFKRNKKNIQGAL